MITSIKEFRDYLNENLLIPRRSKEERNLKLWQNNYKKLNQNETFEGELVINYGYDFPDTYDISKFKLKTVNGTVKLNLDHIPKWLQNITINGDLMLVYNRISTLKNCPSVINGSFYCYGNRITSLEHCPKVINGVFSCYKNKLISLEHCPTTINGTFNCEYNNLTSLKYSPIMVSGNFICSNNQLTSLEGCPTTVDGDFLCYQNPLPIRIQQPTGIKGSFYHSLYK